MSATSSSDQVPLSATFGTSTFSSSIFLLASIVIAELNFEQFSAMSHMPSHLSFVCYRTYQLFPVYDTFYLPHLASVLDDAYGYVW